MSYKKPILCVKNAKSRAGRLTAETKSGVLSGGMVETEALFRQTGIILTQTLEELFDVAMVLSHQPLPKGNKTAIVANSAGMATIFADSSEANGLEIPENCLINLGAFTSPDKYEKAVYETLLNKYVDSLLIGYACVGSCGPDLIAEGIRKGVSAAERQLGFSKPILLCLMGATGTISLVKEDSPDGNGRMFPAFRFPESASRALGRVVRYAEFKKQPAGEIAWYEDVAADKAREIIQSILEKNKNGTEEIKVNTEDAEKILDHFGLNITDKIAENEKPIKINVWQDKLFGPLMKLKAPTYHSVVHITPLTDRDIKESLEETNLKNVKGIAQTLGRISQLIEEIPWLWKLGIIAIPGDQPTILPGITMIVKPGGVKRPVY